MNNLSTGVTSYHQGLFVTFKTIPLGKNMYKIEIFYNYFLYLDKVGREYRSFYRNRYIDYNSKTQKA